MTGLTVPRLRSSSPASLELAAAAFVREGREVRRLVALLEARAGDDLRWTGAAADAARARRAEVAGSLDRLAVGLESSAMVLRRAADQMGAARRLVVRADARARDAGAWVDDGGALVLPPRGAAGDPVVEAHRLRQAALLRDDVQACMVQARRLADAADLRLARDLAASAGGATASVPPGAAPVPAPPTVSRDPTAGSTYASAAWWRGLTEEERTAVLVGNPEWVGPRDGIPADARHRANLRLLARAEQQARVDLARRQRAGLTPFDVEMGARAKRRVLELRAVRDVLATADGNERQLLLLDTSEPDLQAVVALGDVDTAQHVVTFVGGYTTTVGGDLGRYDGTFVPLRSDAVMRSGGQRVAVVTWMGYDAPQVHEVTGPRSVLRPWVAERSGDELAAFLTGVSAGRDEPVHQTVWAHSYGSVVAGYALRCVSSVDDVVVLGSPGLPFQGLESTGLRPGGLGEVHADDDAVVRWGSVVLGTPAASVRGVVHLSAGGAGTRASHGHSAYLRRGSTSADGLVAVAVGRPPARRDGAR